MQTDNKNMQADNKNTGITNKNINNKINFLMLAKDLKTKEKYKVKALDFITATVLVEKNNEVTEKSLNDVRLLAYTRKKDINGRRLFEHSLVEITKFNGKTLKGIILNLNGVWYVKDYINQKITKINKDDKLEKIFR